jgi:DNA polymerase III subunit delta
MELDDKNRYERLTETLGEHCGMVELARVNEEDAMRWAVATAQKRRTRAWNPMRRASWWTRWART